MIPKWITATVLATFVFALVGIIAGILYALTVGQLYNGIVDSYLSHLSQVLGVVIPCMVGGLIAGYAAAAHYGRFAWDWVIPSTSIIVVLPYLTLLVQPSYSHSHPMSFDEHITMLAMVMALALALGFGLRRGALIFMRNRKLSSHKGFSYTELMFVVAIIAILSASGWSRYVSPEQKAQKAKLPDAHDAITTIVNLQERFFTENNRYTANPTELGYTTNTPNSNKGFWQLSIPTATANSYTIRATLITSHTDSDCAQVEQNSLGIRSPPTCW